MHATPAPYIIDGFKIERVDCDSAEYRLERLSTALDAYNRLDLADDGTVEAAERCIRAQNRLIDACYACGMPHDGDEFTWAAGRVARWLAAA